MKRIEVTGRGTLVARLSPVARQQLPPRLRRLLQEGQASYDGVPLELPSPVKMSPGDKTAVDCIREQRR